jgi:hypothetical protein
MPEFEELRRVRARLMARQKSLCAKRIIPENTITKYHNEVTQKPCYAVCSGEFLPLFPEVHCP